MKATNLLLLPALLVSGAAFAQTGSNPPMTNVPTAPQPHVVEVEQPPQKSALGATASPGDTTDPAKIAAYQERFAQGLELEKQGKIPEARAIYEGILAEEPNAKGSLLRAGTISFQQGELAKADDYFERLHKLVPDFPDAIQFLILINQQLKRDVKVELLIRDFARLRASGKNPKLSSALMFTREEIHQDKQDIFVSQFFDYTQDPGTVWMAEIHDADGNLQRRLLLNYDADTTKALRAKDPKYADTQVFNWVEHKMVGGKVTELDVYLQIFALPDYDKFRSAMFVILADPPKPIYSAPINTDAAPAPAQ